MVVKGFYSQSLVDFVAMLFTIGLKTMLQTPLFQTVSLYFKFKNYI